MSASSSRKTGVLLTIGMVAAALTFLVAVLDESRSFDNPMPVFVMLGGLAVFLGLMRSPVGKAIGRMLDEDHLPDEQLAMRVEDLEARLADLSLEQSRVMELESRLDFAERMLTARGGDSNGGT